MINNYLSPDRATLRKARWLIAIFILSFLNIGNVFADDPIVINNDSVSLGNYNSSESTFTVRGITIGYKNWTKTNNGTPTNWAANQLIQWKKNASAYGQCYNKTAISGLTKVRIYTQSGTNFDIYAGTSMITSKPASGKITFPAQKTGTATVTVNHRYGGTLEADIDYYDISLGSGNSYFYIGTNNTAVCYTYKIEIYYSSGYTVGYLVNPTGKATVTLGSTSVASGSTTTATYSNVTAGYEFQNWSISGTGASLSSTTSNPTTITVGSANVTVTANLQCITPSISVQPAASTTCLVGASPELSVTAAAGGASLSYQWKQCATVDGTYVNVASGGNSSTYSPSTAAAGTTYYKCVITNAASGCSTTVTSDAAQVTVNAGSTWKFKYSGDSYTEHTMTESAGVASYSISLAADSRFEFGFDDNGSAFYKNNGTMITTTSGWVFNTSDNNCKIHTGPAGTYTFAINTTTKAVTVTYPDVTHPNDHYVYFKNSDVWGTVYGYLYNTGNDNKAAAWPGSVMQATTTICGETYHYAALNAMSGTYNSIKFNDGGSGYGHETSALSTTSSLGKFNANRDANWHAFKYTISFNGNGNTSGSMSDLSNICIGSNQALTSNAFAKTYYTFAGWHADVDVKVGESTISAGDMISNGVTIKDIQSNIALEAQWSVIPVTAMTLNYSTLKKYVGESSVTLSVASVTPGTANPAVTWTSSDGTVASVTDGGVVSFLKAGTATITATSTISGSITATCSVEVRSISSPTMQDEDGTTISGSGLSATWTLGTRTLTASEGTSKYKFKRWIVTNATPASTTNLSTTLGDPTGNVTVVAEFYKPRTVTKGTGTGTSTFTVSPTGEVKHGSSVTVTCAAADGYKNPWTLTVTPSDGATYSSSGSDGSITISNITKNITIDLEYTDRGCTDHGASSITSGASTGYTQGPVDEFYKYSTRQIIYTKSDLGLAAGKKGTIKSISFQYGYGTAMTKKTDVDIYLANTNLTSLTTGSYVPYANFTKVYSGALNCSGNGTWNEFEFTTSFEYNGVGQLVVMIDDNSGDYDGMYYVFQCHSGVSGAQVYKRQDSDGDIDPETWTPANETDSRPNTKFCIEEADMVEATVNWYVNGSVEHTQTDYPGTAFDEIPTPVSGDCDGEKEFVGWYTDDYTHASVAPAFVNPTVIPEGGADYYAVFATVTPTNNYQQITSEGDLVAGAKYVIVGNSSTAYNALPVDAATSLSPVSPSGTPLTISSPGSTLIWTLEGSADAWKIKSTSNNKYLQISEGNLTFETSTSLTFSVGVSSNIFTFTSSAASGNKILSYYPKNTCFNAFTGPNNVYVFKQVVNATNYVTTCAETYNVTRAGTPAGTVTGGTFTVSPSKQAAGKTVTLSTTPDLGYAFGSWTVTKTESPYTDITSTNVAGNTLTMPAYDVTVNATFTPSPELTATGGNLDGTTLPFGTSCEQDEGTDKTFVLNGYSLTNDVTLTITGTDASMFSVKSPSSPISKGSGRITDETVTITFTPTSTGAKTATLTISSTGATSKTITLSGTAIKHYKVHYWNSGEDVHQESVLAGADATATWDGVGDGDGCDAVTYRYFIGWSKTNIGSTPTSTKPTMGGTYSSLSADVNYYAIWSNVNPGGWERYESSTIAEGDYLVVEKIGDYYRTMKNSMTGTRMNEGVAKFSGSLITDPTNELTYDWADYIWHIAKPDPDEAEYTFYNADESKYVVSTGTASQVDFVASPSNGKELFTYTYNSTSKTYNWTNKYNSTNSVNATFRNAGSGFSCYASDTHSQYLYYRPGGTAMYKTTCCEYNVTLADGSPSHGSITFDPAGPVETCSGSKNVTMTITPDAGYYLSDYDHSGVNTSNSPTIATSGSTSEAAQDVTLTFAQNTTSGTYTADATFSQIMVSSLNLRVQQTGQDDKVGNDLTMTCYPKEGQTGGNDPLSHSLNVAFASVLPANALDKTYDWSVRVKATGDADWTDVGFTGNSLNTNSLINTFTKSTGLLKIGNNTGTAEIKITANDGSGVFAKVTITIASVSMTGVSVDPTSMEVYAGEKKPVAITFEPANATTRTYSTGSYSYVTIRSSGSNPFYIEGKSTSVVRNETVTVTTTDGSFTATIDVTVNPLPQVTFLDIVHNKTDFTTDGDDLPASGIIASTASEGVVTHSKKTPTRAADVTDPGVWRNTCEREHLHLIGWIRSDYDKVEDYLNGTGSQLTITQIISAGNDGLGHAYFLAPDVSIDVRDYEGKTFYAVWAKIE